MTTSPSSLVISDNLPILLEPVEKLCRLFSLAEILQATQNFDDSLVIGKGGFGQVYKGDIDINGANVAIKRMNSTSKQGDSQFRTEIEMLSKFQHSHILSLIGYCYTSSEMILVYEYMINGSLADHLYKTGTNGSGCCFSWVQRLNICLGAARGLDYLHTGTSVQESVIHRDVKSSNILLDKKWSAKISDFGLSKTNPVNKSYAHTNPKGTIGYMDPEYLLTRRLRMKSDVYSFGVVLFEVLCGRRARDLTLDEEQWSLADWALHCIEEGILHRIIDPNLSWEISPNSLKKFVEIARLCLCYDSKKRPTMTQVTASLELAIDLQLRTDSSLLAMDIFVSQENVDSTLIRQEAIEFRNWVKPMKRNAFKNLLRFLNPCMASEARGRKLVAVKRTSQDFNANRETCHNNEEMAFIDDRFEKADKKIQHFDTSSHNKEKMVFIDNRFEKADTIFRHFDTNGDDCLNKEEIREMLIISNPRIKFTDEHINALVIEFFQIYTSFIDGENGLSYLGFLQMYDDCVGDLDRDFATLGFEL